MKKFIYHNFFFVLIIFQTSYFFTACNSSNHSIRAINFRSNLTSIFDPEAYAIDEGRYLYYYKDYTILFIERHILNYGVITPDSNNIYSGNVVHRTLVFNYFVFKNNTNSGIRYDSLNVQKGIRVAKDSILKNYANMKSSFYEMKSHNLVHSEILTDGTLLQKYAAIDNAKPLEYSDSVYCYFSKKLKGIDFSFNKPLDNLMGMKLFKIEFVYDTLYKSKPKDEIGIPRICISEMKKINVKNPDLIIFLCQRYEKEVNNK